MAEFCNLRRVREEIFHLIKSQLINRSAFRISIAINANYEIPDLSEEGEQQARSLDNDTFTLRSKGIVVNEFEENRSIKNKISFLLRGALAREEDLLTRGSGWHFESLQSCDILFYDICYVRFKKIKE